MKHLERTAYHEAGHMVVSHYLSLPVLEVSIVAGEEEGFAFAGFAHLVGEFGHMGNGLVDEDAENLSLIAPEAFWMRQATVRYAGAEAVRRLSPRSRWRDGAQDDCRWAANALERVTSHPASLAGLHTYTAHEARALVERHWAAIDHVAKALLRKGRLSGDEAKAELYAVASAMLEAAAVKKPAKLVKLRKGARHA